MLLCMGVSGCSPAETPAPPPPAPPLRLTDTPGLIQRVKEAKAADGSPYAAWVEKEIARTPKRVLFSDWSAGPGTVRFTYVVRDHDYRITQHAFEWQVSDMNSRVPPPRHTDLAGEVPHAVTESAISDLRTAFERDLLPWFAGHQRSMPWRSNRTAYRVWISELMLQQTRVDTVRPYFQRWMRRFPSLRALAQAPLQDVLKQWEGLGYYARARNAHRTAQELVQNRGGRFPQTAAELRELPGIGPYTAAAIASLAFNQPVAVLDGNVMRVLSRLLACPQDIRLGATRHAMQAWADQLLKRDQPGASNEALMELGATVCTPAPDCPRCPLRGSCQALAAGNPESYPVKKKADKVPHRHVGAGIIVRRDGRILIAQRRENAMLGGMWEFPGGGQEAGETLEQCVARELQEELGIRVRVGPHFLTVAHAFSHFTMDLHAYWVRIDSGRPRPLHCADLVWVAPRDIAAYPLPRADQHILARLLKVESPPQF